MSIKTSIETYTGTIASEPVQEYFIDSLKSIVMGIGSLRPDLLTLFGKTSSITTSGETITGTILDVEYNGEMCRNVEASMRKKLDEADSIYATTSNDPAYYILGNKVFVSPDPGVDAIVDISGVSDITAHADGTQINETGHGLCVGDLIVVYGTTGTKAKYLNGDWRVVTEIDNDNFSIAADHARYYLAGAGWVYTDSKYIKPNATLMQTAIDYAIDVTADEVSAIDYFPEELSYLPVYHTAANILNKKLFELSLPSKPTMPIPPSEPNLGTPSEAPNTPPTFESITMDIETITASTDYTSFSGIFAHALEFAKDGDTEEAAGVTAALNTYMSGVQAHLSNSTTAMQADLSRYQAEMQSITATAANLLQSEIQEYSNQLNKYSQEVNAAVGAFGQEMAKWGAEVSNTVQIASAESQDKMAKYQGLISAETQAYSASVQTENAKFQSLSTKYTLELQKISQSNQEKVGLYNAAIQIYGAEASNGLQLYTANLTGYSTDLQRIGQSLSHVTGLIQDGMKTLVSNQMAQPRE